MPMSKSKRKKERGRPMKRRYAPRVDAMPETMAKAMFALPADHQWKYEKASSAVYWCESCEREVAYPETLYREGRCENCQKAPVK